ncbi:hypothetical protein FGB62_177g011 [Gracilaria domingensis]|nr:hypothetical protein FGB62_177g011 [Gracilaria domingensis]
MTESRRSSPSIAENTPLPIQQSIDANNQSSNENLQNSLLPDSNEDNREPSLSTRTISQRELPPNAGSQAILSAACKRLGMSGSGSKSVLIGGLEQKGISSFRKIVELNQLFHESGADPSEGNGRSRAPNWTKEESARLCHVIADSRHATVVAKLYQRISTRAEPDKPHHDPFAEEFCLLFNDTEFKPEPPEPYDGVTLDVFMRFDPSIRRHHRDGQTLKQKWTKLRSSYSIASKNFEASGQGDADTFPSFSQGDDVLCYMHCVFHEHPSIEAVLRLMPSGAQIESGLEDTDFIAQNDRSAIMSAKKRRHVDATHDLDAAITSLASSREKEGPIIIQDSNSNTAAVENQIVELDRSMKIASTVSSLMDLEAKIIGMIKGLESDDEYSKRSLESYKRRLTQVEEMINKAMAQKESANV